MAERERKLKGTTAYTPMGCVAIAMSESGLVAVSLPKPDCKTAWQEIESLANGEVVRGTDPLLARVADLLRRFYDGEATDFSGIPLDWSVGTPFLREVWKTVREVPRGQTVTYGEVAAMIGRPKAARAVGLAMARNPWPPIVPCHRVVGAGGRLIGFGGGLELKRKMLEMEGAF